MHGIEVRGCGFEVVGVREGDTRGEGTGNRFEQHSMLQRGRKMGGLE